jgi:hypothetical protein
MFCRWLKDPPPAGKGRGEEAEPDSLLPVLFSRWRVKPRAASGGGAWRGRAATVQVPRRCSQHCSGGSQKVFGFGVYFCNFWIVFDLF